MMGMGGGMGEHPCFITSPYESLDHSLPPTMPQSFRTRLNQFPGMRPMGGMMVWSHPRSFLDFFFQAPGGMGGMQGGMGMGGMGMVSFLF